jgi:hypothetical protein
MKDISKFINEETGRYLTQSLFIEVGYEVDKAIYTIKDRDHEYKGKVYPSLKRLYLEMEDPTEYNFAQTYFASWPHWMRIYENKLFKTHIDEWREELEFKLRSKAAKQMIELAAQGNYQASKWLLDRGWTNRPAGRPSKAEKEAALAQDKRITDEYSADVIRLRQS